LCTFARATQKPYVQDRFVAIQQKSRDWVDLYLVNTPISTAVPYFEITMEFGVVDYVAEYTPQHSGEQLPEAMTPDDAGRSRTQQSRQASPLFASARWQRNAIDHRKNSVTRQEII
jgi:hypothetical protein